MISWNRIHRRDYTDQVDEWINNEGTQNSIKYLTNSSNFIHYIFVTEKEILE